MSEPSTAHELAAWVRKRHGDNAIPYVAQQLGCAMIAGDEAGTERWHKVADCIAPRPAAATGQRRGSL